MDQCTVKAINDHVWLMRDEHNDTCYLIAGQKKALVADTMSGFLNVREQAEKLTSLPFMVINTHGHGDHVLGNTAFEEAYLHPADQFMIDNLLQSPQYKAARKKQGIRMPEMKPVRGGDTFDLGGLTA